MTKRKRKSSKSRSRKRAATPLWRRVLLLCFGLAIVLFTGWVIYLDVEVRSKFDGRKWALPARVYAQPLELYVGQKLTQNDLLLELKALSYQSSDHLAREGQYRRRGQWLDIYVRGFTVAADSEPARAVGVRIENSQVVELVNGAGNALTMTRLEPVLIGGIYPRRQEDRELVQLQQIPPLLGEALIAVEDRNFIRHWGVSPKAIARAALVNVQSGRVVQGGSTLTQQLVKNFFLQQDRSLRRKVVEAMMSLLLELHYDKAEILETYINEVYLGQSGPRQIHGFGLAATHYFRQHLQQLEVQEIALLVGLVKGASYYNPWRHPERALKRRNVVLDVMAEQGLLTASQVKQAKSKPLGVIDKNERRLHDFPAFIALVKRQLREEYSDEALSSDGLSVYTTLSLRAQRQAEKAVREQLQRLEADRGAKELQGALALAAIGTGEVEALVGDRNTQFSGFNRALDARRSIGSLAKPVVYLTALEQGLHLASTISDAPVTVAGPDGKLWQPRNFDHQSHGDVLLIDSLVNSYNQATARLGMNLGLDAVVNTFQRLGVQGHVQPVPATLLGSVSLTPYQVLGLYHTLANDGVYSPLRAIRSVVGTDGIELSRYPLDVREAVAPEAVQLLQFALQSVMQEGTGRSIYRALPSSLLLAGKTGTTNDQRDSWFAGFGGQHLAVTWVGRDDNGETPLTGATGALQVWQQLFMSMPTEGLRIQASSDIDYLWIDENTGALSGENCEGSRLLPFTKDGRPENKTQCSWRANPVYHWLNQWLR